jgi:hypothetical protein
LQPDLAVPEPLIWSGTSDPDGRVRISKSYPLLRSLTVEQRRDLGRRLMGKDENMEKLCAALVAEGRDLAQSLRDQHVEQEQQKLVNSPPAPLQGVPPEQQQELNIHPTGVGASRGRRRGL